MPGTPKQTIAARADLRRKREGKTLRTFKGASLRVLKEFAAGPVSKSKRRK